MASMKMNRYQKICKTSKHEGDMSGRQQALDCCVQTSVAYV